MHLYKTEKLITFKSVFIACLAFMAVIVFCMFLLGSLSGKVDRNETDTLKNAIDNAIVTCYSIEGRYPENLEYIEENYGVVIDEERFFVTYSAFAPNVKPYVTVIRLDE